MQSVFAGAMYSQMPSYLTERFPTEVRATASAFCYHQAAIFGGAVAPVLTYFAVDYQLGFAIPMLIGTSVGLVSVVIALLVSPEDQGPRVHVRSRGHLTIAIRIGGERPPPIRSFVQINDTTA